MTTQRHSIDIQKTILNKGQQNTSTLMELFKIILYEVGSCPPIYKCYIKVLMTSKTALACSTLIYVIEEKPETETFTEWKRERKGLIPRQDVMKGCSNYTSESNSESKNLLCINSKAVDMAHFWLYDQKNTSNIKT